LAALMATLDELPKPTIARVNGAALGGGTGLVACCDIALASAEAKFGTTEVRLGLIPAVIGPYVVAAIGVRQARRLMLTGERISAVEAARIGLVHEVVEAEQLDGAVARLLDDLLKGGPAALAAAKRLVRDLAGRPLDAELIDDTAQRIALLRATAEGREGVAAFLDKRRPGWLA
jgi:methylglutaconyl-CoA hydratase